MASYIIEARNGVDLS